MTTPVPELKPTQEAATPQAQERPSSSNRPDEGIKEQREFKF